jgi:hypothetical protein
VSSNSNYDLIFERWKASLQTKKKDYNHRDGNFDELFEQLKNAGASLVDAKAILPNAIKAHQPSSSTAKFVWNSLKRNPKFAGVSENEFVADWNQDIAASATNSLFVFFPISDDSDDDGTPKIFGDGKISSREHAKMLAHSEEFELLDVQEMEQQDRIVTEKEMLSAIGENDE